MKKSFVAMQKFGMTVGSPESKLYHRYFTMSFTKIHRTCIEVHTWLRVSEYKIKSSIIWIRLKPFWTSVLALLIFQTDIMGEVTATGLEPRTT